MTEQATKTQRRIVRAASELLVRGGRKAVTTRAFSAAAGVQAPTIYRQFGDMRGLLDAVARETLSAYVREKAVRAQTDDRRSCTHRRSTVSTTKTSHFRPVTVCPSKAGLSLRPGRTS